MAKRQISIQPMDTASFASFGDVLSLKSKPDKMINQGMCGRHHDLAKLDFTDGQAGISLFDAVPRQLPYTLDMMERHPLGSQAFIPLSDNPYLVIVAPPGELDESMIKVFKASPKQGVNYHPGTWPHYSLALEGVSDFLVVDRGSPQADPDIEEENCDEVTLSQSIEIQL